MFSQVSACLQWECLPLVWGRCLPRWRGVDCLWSGGSANPLGPEVFQTPPGRLSQANTPPLSRHHPDQRSATTPRQTPSPPGKHPPADTTGYGQQEGSMHPTGMHCCFVILAHKEPKDISLHLCWSLPPASEVCGGYVFTHVCHSAHGGVSRPRPSGEVGVSGWGGVQAQAQA